MDFGTLLHFSLSVVVQLFDRLFLLAGHFDSAPLLDNYASNNKKKKSVYASFEFNAIKSEYGPVTASIPGGIYGERERESRFVFCFVKTQIFTWFS